MMVASLALGLIGLVLLYRLSLWAAPLLAGYASGATALALGSGWAMALAAAFVAACFVHGLVRLGSAHRSPLLRGTAFAVALLPPIWAGAIASMAIAERTGAKGPVWTLLAVLGGALCFGAIALSRLSHRNDRSIAARLRPGAQR